MGASGSAVRIRHGLHARLAEARKRTDEVFQIVREEAMYDRPISERHRIIFYVGHVEAFDWNLLAERAFGLQPFHASFDRLFAFGIDPIGGGLPTDQPADWPARQEIDRYNHRLREELDGAIARALAEPAEGHPPLMQMLEVAIEHRLMHAETLSYMLHQLPADRKIPAEHELAWKTPRAKSHLVDINAGYTTLGLRRETSDEFGWDNEFESHETFVPEFAIDNYNVKNRDFLLFMQAGGYADKSLWDAEGWAWKRKDGVEHPTFWRRSGNLWMYRTMFGDIQLPLDWPVYVSHAEATAYAKWLGRRLPSEEQFHRAAYGTSDERVERSYPWGEEAPSSRYGNFDFQHWDVSPVGSYPRGASAFGVHDIVGNGWEWTRTQFAPFPGFTPMPFYPGYSANFFDDKHYVMKGGSPRTAACMLRRSFRNWFQPHYPYVYATFRCVED
jgi:gamma-glutamyl hercynylcysteine S-oxide synthase